VATGWWTAEFVAAYPGSRGRPFYLIQGYEDWAGPRERVDATWRLPLRKVVVSSWLLRKGIELGIPVGDMRLVPDGLRLDDHPLQQPVWSRPNVVAMLHDEAAWKGSADGLRAVELARASHPDLRALLFGVAEAPAGLPAWASYLHSPGRETLVRDVYNASAIFVCPSRSEGWGLPSAEAMACGCALVTTPLAGDYAVEGDTARFAEAGSPESLAERIVELLDDPLSRVGLAERGRDRIAAFTWERSTNAFERALLDGLSGAWTTGGG
jgi:glycosyltransferase involved in cell wall biosynthesis